MIRAFLTALLLALPAHAWDRHQEMVDRMLLGPAAEDRAWLRKRVEIPCIDEERKEIDSLAARIGVRAEAVPGVSKKKCGAKGSQMVTVEELLALGFIDEPDHGMDQDLPESADPNHYRKWMGGSTGPTSQGFRHMVFPGIEWSSPLATFQIPFAGVGEAPGRIEVLKKASDSYFAEGNVFFGLRTLLWREHLIEDLLQPFHSTQIPSFQLVPWRKALKSPVQATSHAIANYHYAFEGLVLELVRTPWEKGIQGCLEGRDARAYDGGPRALDFVRSKAREAGQYVFGVFGDYLKSDEVDLPAGIGQVDYDSLVNSPSAEFLKEEVAMLGERDREEYRRARERAKAVDGIRALSCELMKEAARTFWGDLDQSFSKVPSNTTGK
ncbi:MAG: hypothetical protein EBX52_02315 [Proteobacteria bacterium]|nr:hypothetical protein [Pseudomonadota bacterium]